MTGIVKEKDVVKAVYACVTADLFHFGHVRFLKAARAHGQSLMVGVCGDDAVASYKRHPILSVEERAETVAACRYVDEVIVGADPILTDAFLDNHHIDIVIASKDYNEDVMSKYYGVAMARGMVRLVDYTPDICTTDIIYKCYRAVIEFDAHKAKLT